jgi:hypothetical protein
VATTTRTVMRQRLSEAHDDYQALTTSAAGSTTTLRDSSLADLPGGNDDDFCLGWYVLITHTDHGSEGEIRRVKSYARGTQIITVESAFTAPIEISKNYELHRINPDLKHNALSRALEEVYPDLYLPLRNEEIVIDDLLTNSDFEGTISGSVHPSWANVNSPAVTAETTTVYHLGQSAKVISHGSTGAGQMTQAPSVNIAELAGRTATFRRWVWSAVASEARVRLDFDGAQFENSDYHTGDSSWRLLSASGAIPTDATQVKCICEVIVGTKTAYFDGGGGAGLFVHPVHKYTVPTAFIGNPRTVRQQHNVKNVDGPYYPIVAGSVPTQGRLIRLEGMGLLSRPSTESGTTEIGEPRLSLVIYYASSLLNQMLVRGAAEDDRRRYIDDAADDMTKYERLLSRPGMRMAKMGAEMARQNWHFEEDADGRYLIMDRVRESVSS